MSDPREGRLGSELALGSPGTLGTDPPEGSPGTLGDDPPEGKPGSELAEGNPGRELALGSPGTLGTDPPEGKLGSELAEGSPGTLGDDPPEGKPGSELAEGNPGRELALGSPGTDPLEGRLVKLGNPEGPVTQNFRPPLLDAWTDPPPPGVVALPPPEAVIGLGNAGRAGVLVQCEPAEESDEGSVVSEAAPGSDVGTPGLWLAPLGSAPPTASATAATPTAPLVSRTIRV